MASLDLIYDRVAPMLRLLYPLGDTYTIGIRDLAPQVGQSKTLPRKPQSRRLNWHQHQASVERDLKGVSDVCGYRTHQVGMANKPYDGDEQFFSI
jgi:hypothetical protein